MYNRTTNKTPRWIKARFDSKCPETGKIIKKGQDCIYYPAERKAYHETSRAAEHVRGLEFASNFNMMDQDW